MTRKNRQTSAVPVEPVTVKKQLKFPRIYVGPTLKIVGLKYGQVFSGPEYPPFIKELMVKAPALASLIFNPDDIKAIPDAVVSAFLSQLKR